MLRNQKYTGDSTIINGVGIKVSIPKPFENTLILFENTLILFENTLILFENTPKLFENILILFENYSLGVLKQSQENLLIPLFYAVEKICYLTAIKKEPSLNSLYRRN